MWHFSQLAGLSILVYRLGDKLFKSVWSRYLVCIWMALLCPILISLAILKRVFDLFLS
jgi:hypothetical protein